MATVITMPRLSDTMTEGTVATWLKKVGDTIKEGDILAEIETDKATMEFESFNSGVLLHIGIQEGQSAPVDSLLAIIGKEGEDISSLISNSSNPKSQDEKVEVKEDLTQPTTQNLQPTTLPAGVKVITMPRLSDTMSTGTVATWLKKVGDIVKEGDILAEIETDKATMEFESFNAGTLLFIGINKGSSEFTDPFQTANVKQLDLFAIHPNQSVVLEILHHADHTLRRHSGQVAEVCAGKRQVKRITFKNPVRKTQQNICQAAMQLLLGQGEETTINLGSTFVQ